jgi:hypothetical protein
MSTDKAGMKLIQQYRQDKNILEVNLKTLRDLANCRVEESQEESQLDKYLESIDTTSEDQQVSDFLAKLDSRVSNFDQMVDQSLHKLESNQKNELSHFQQQYAGINAQLRNRVLSHLGAQLGGTQQYGQNKYQAALSQLQRQVIAMQQQATVKATVAVNAPPKSQQWAKHNAASSLDSGSTFSTTAGSKGYDKPNR